MKQTIQKMQEIYLTGGHVCGDCKNGAHGTCFGTCICAFCEEYWETVEN